MKKVNSSNNELFLQLYTRHEPSVRAFIRNGLYNSHDVADVMQKVAIIAWNKFDQLKDPESGFGKWICVIARYEVMSFRRQKSRENELIDHRVMDIILHQGVEEYDKRQKSEEFMEACISNLKEGDRKLLEIAYHSEISIKKFAQMTNKPVQALYQKLNRIRTKLADCVYLKLNAQNL
jgi:RNA polymerase sigma-70 factor (ECF subfamily)